MNPQETAVLIDMDGVIIDAERFSTNFDSDFGIDPRSLDSFFEDRFQRCLIGKGNLKKELNDFLPSIGWKDSVESFVDYWFHRELSPNEEVLTLCNKLSSIGFSLYVASNQERERATFLVERLNLRSMFSGFYFSYSIGSKKPSSRYFEYINKDLELQGFRTVILFDDSKRNVESALNQGWKSVLFERNDDLKSAFSSFCS